VRITGTQTCRSSCLRRPLGVVFVDPAGYKQHVPALWSGGEWRVRYASSVPGMHWEIRLHAGWSARYVDPRTGSEHDPRTVTPDAARTYTIGGGFLTSNPSMEDWVLVLEHRRGGVMT
jgi:hypothetical protein